MTADQSLRASAVPCALWMPVTSPSSIPLSLSTTITRFCRADVQTVLNFIEHDIVRPAVPAKGVGVRDAARRGRLRNLFSSVVTV